MTDNQGYGPSHDGGHHDAPTRMTPASEAREGGRAWGDATHHGARPADSFGRQADIPYIDDGARGSAGARWTPGGAHPYPYSMDEASGRPAQAPGSPSAAGNGVPPTQQFASRPPQGGQWQGQPGASFGPTPPQGNGPWQGQGGQQFAPTGPHGPGPWQQPWQHAPGQGFVPGQMPYAPSGGIDPFTGEPLSDKSKVVAGLLQFFFGTFGVGRFYIGDNRIGGIQLALGLIGFFGTFILIGFPILIGVGIWAFIDAILMLTGGVRDPYGRKLS